MLSSRLDSAWEGKGSPWVPSASRLGAGSGSPRSVAGSSATTLLCGSSPQEGFSSSQLAGLPVAVACTVLKNHTCTWLGIAEREKRSTPSHPGWIFTLVSVFMSLTYLCSQKGMDRTLTEATRMIAPTCKLLKSFGGVTVACANHRTLHVNGNTETTTDAAAQLTLPSITTDTGSQGHWRTHCVNTE